MLAKLQRELAAGGVQLRLVAALPPVRDLLRGEGLQENIDYFGRRIAVADLIDAVPSTGPKESA